MGCAFCRSHAVDLFVHGNERASVLLDHQPLVDGHILVVPVVHHPSVLDLSVAGRAAVLRAVAVAREVTKHRFGAALVLEHGRSPTCGDASGACHAHIHVLPVGTSELPEGIDGLLSKVGEPPSNAPYLAHHRSDGIAYYRTLRPLRHLARTIATLAAVQSGIQWRPLAVPVEERSLRASLAAARAVACPPVVATRVPRALRRAHAKRLPGPVAITGPTGSGKSTAGDVLARRLSVPVVELGVVLRLVCLGASGLDERQVASRLWRWARRGSLDFQGASTLGLAAALPRLDGRAAERPLWSDPEASRLAELSASPIIQEALEELAARASREHGAIVVSRIAPGERYLEVALDADPKIRAARKARQLARVQLRSDRHPWFTPTLGAASAKLTGAAIDTSELSVREAARLVEATIATSMPDLRLAS